MSTEDFSKNPKTIDLVVAAYIIKDGKVLLINHKKLNKWLPVGGHIEPNETPDDAIKREVSEEVGLEIEFLDFYPETKFNKKQFAKPLLINTHPIKENHFHYSLFYLCTPKTELKEHNKNELNGVHWFSKEELKHNMFENTEIAEDVREICLKFLSDRIK